MKKIVAIGGGNAMPNAVLKGLKHYKDVEISAICAMLDTGGSSGRLRRDYGILSPGDIRRSLIALADISPVVKNLLDYRFEDGELKGHNFANLLISALELSINDREKALKELKRMLKVSHSVFPATLQDSELCIELQDGTIVSGETNIDIPKHDGNMEIKRVFLRPPAKAYPKAIHAIEESDIIVIGPGDVFSSLAQVLLTEGTKEAIKRSKGKAVYVCNLMNKHGETNGFTVSDLSKKIEAFIETDLDYVIYNNEKPSPARIKKFKEKNPQLIDVVDYKNNLKENKFIGANVITSSGDVVHDPEKLAKIILNLC